MTAPDRDIKARTTLGLDQDVMDLLRQLAAMEHRSMAGEVSFLVTERARVLGLHTTGHVSEEKG